MYRLARRARRLASRVLSVSVALSLLSPSSLVCSALAAQVVQAPPAAHTFPDGAGDARPPASTAPRPPVAPAPLAQVPPVALELLEELDGLLARDARPQVKTLLAKAWELQQACGGNKAVDYWVEGILAGPLAGLPGDSVPSKDTLQPARESLPVLRGMIRKGISNSRASLEGFAPAVAPNPGMRVAQSRIKNLLSTIAPAAPPQDAVLANPGSGTTASGLAPSPKAPLPSETELMDEVKRAREELAAAERLSQRTDLSDPVAKERAEELRALGELLRGYEGMLGGDGDTPAGLRESGELRQAALSALRRLMKDFSDPKPSVLDPAPKRPMTEAEKKIAAALDAVDKAKSQAQEELGTRDATAGALAVADKVRSGALRDRRSGKEMLEFRKNFARLAMVMDLSYSLNILNSADQALTGMLDLIDKKIGKIDSQRKKNDQSGAASEEQRKKKEEWLKDQDATIAEDKKNIDDFSSLARKIARYVLRMDEAKTSFPALLSLIDARDKGQSASAKEEYARRLALLPEVQRKLARGSGSTGDEIDISLDYLKGQSADVAGYLDKLKDAVRQIDEAPIEFAGVMVVLVPGIPSTNVRSPSPSQVIALLNDRKNYWQDMLDDHLEILQTVEDYQNPGNQKRVIDDFGDSVPESLVVWQAEERAKGDRARALLSELAAEADEIAHRMAAQGASLPTLSGRSPSELRSILESYADQFMGVEFPDTEEGFILKVDKLALAGIVVYMADALAIALVADGKVNFLQKAISDILPKAKARFQDSTNAIRAVIQDVDMDVAFVNAGFPPSQFSALIARKRSLVGTTLKGMLGRMQVFLDQVVIPFWNERIQASDPNNEGDSYALLYKERAKLYDRIKKAQDVTVPWAVASDGAKEGNVAQAREKIGRLKEKFGEYVTLVADLKDQVRRRQDPNLAETEEVYGEQAPYSFIVRIRKYQAEKAAKAAELNTRAGEINGILRQMDSLSGNAHNLASRFSLPTGLSATDPETAKKLRKMADDRVLQTMADAIKKIAQDAQAAAGDTDIGVGGSDGTVPTGAQPPVDINNQLKLALFGLEVCKRLVPTQNFDGTSYAESLARFLFADALVLTAQRYLDERIPVFAPFLDKAGSALNELFADFDADLSWVGGDLSNGKAVLDRKVPLYVKIRDIATAGAELFGLKIGWDNEAYDTINTAIMYYDTMGEVYEYGNEALDKDLDAAKKMRDAVSQQREDIRKQRATVVNWLSQLNSPEESALNRVAQNISAVQEKTRVLVETNFDYHKAEDAYKEANKKLTETLAVLSREQTALYQLLEAAGDVSNLHPDLAPRVAEVVRQGTSWLAAGPGGPQTIIIPRSGFSGFLDALFSSFQPESSARDIVALREEILKNPMALAQLLPNSKMVQLGEGANGFYLVYQTEFSTPGGLETTSQVTFGNVLRLWNSNVSVSGHRFASPPSDMNAPFGDQGISVQIESLDGKNYVNYLDITFHKFIQDIPGDLTVAGQAREARMMIFDDFALVMANNKLYFGAAGFADFALSNASERPYYYGGSFKASMKFTEVISLNAEEQLLFAKDPRSFFQTVNLDFTKLDQDLDHDFVISGEGEEKDYRKDKIGVGIDLAQALKDKNTFKLDLYFARVSGTDDYDQSLFGATVLKGFDVGIGTVTVGGGAELGTRYNTYSGRLSFAMPNNGLVFTASGKIIGDADTYFAELRKKLGDNSEVFLSYGSKYIGLNHRLTIGMNSTFTLGELWRAATQDAADALSGSETLAGFNGRLEEFFQKDDPDNPVLSELKRVFDSDVGKKLLTLDIGRLSKDLAELRKAGAILDNTRVSAMIGFVTNPASNDTAERAATGGFQVGTRMEYSMTKSQRALIEGKIASIYSEAVKLQIRLLDLAKAWQLALTDMVQTRWEAALALHMMELAPDASLKAEARTLFIDAQARHRQAALRYNALTGRGPDDTVFFDLNPQDLDRMLGVLEKALANPARLSALVESLRGIKLPEESFNLMDWIPWIEKLTFYVGVQLQDMLSSQILGAGVSVRLPIYDPGAKGAERALLLTNDAIIHEMAQALRNASLRAQNEKLEAQAYDGQLERLSGQGPALAQAVWDAIRAYRNGLIEQGELWETVRRWRWSLTTLMAARTQSSMKSGWAVMDFSLAKGGEIPAVGWRGAMAQPATLGQGIELARKNSLSVEALALRSQAAKELLEAASGRFAKVSVDLNVGVNITAAGVAWIPAFGITGLGIFPIFNVDLRPDELEALSKKRLESEAGLFTRLGSKVSGDIALQLFEAYAAYKSLDEMVGIYERELIPELDSGSGTAGAFALDKALSELFELKGRRKQALSVINYLMGRPLGMRLEMGEDIESSLAKLGSVFSQDPPVAAALDVLRSRLAVARASETIVDKNLKVQNIRFEPISLIGRSLGRLINALSGEGLASPEALALARYQTLSTEADLAAFERGLSAARAKVATELGRVERRMAELQGQSSPRSRAEVAALKSRLYSLKAMALFYGVKGADVPQGGTELPSTYADLASRLSDAYGREAFTQYEFSPSRATPAELPLEAQGNLRYYYLRQSLAKAPIGQHLIEGWVEIRLRSASTPPEALIALANLQKERADQLYQAEQSAARAKAEILLSRLKLYKGLLAGGLTGPRGTDGSDGVRERLSRDFGDLAAHLGLGPKVTLEAVLALLPEDGVNGAEEAARRYVSEVASLDLEHLKRTLFRQGLPGSLRGSADPLLQLKANLIAEKMSYKGFTPVVTFGLFRGNWVGGFILEAPNPDQIQKGLENILTEALKHELESQDRLRTLGLKLHQLMASVADKVRLIDAERERLFLARRNLSGMIERRALGMASEKDVLAAAAEATRTHEDFVETIAALQMDFAVLVTELEALGLGDRGARPPRLLPPDDSAQVLERTAMEKLMSFVSQRLLDEDFEKRLDELLTGVPERLKEELKKNVHEHRTARQFDVHVRYDDFTAAEKLELLTKVDVQGRREKVEKAFQNILDELARGQGSSWQKVMQFLGSDLERQEASAAVDVRDGAQMREVLTETFWSVLPAPPKIDDLYRDLSVLSRGVDAARIKALEMYLAGALRPEDYVTRDAALDDYVGALVAYDEAVLKAFASGDVAASPQWAKALDSIFSLKRSSERRRDYLRYGRGILTIDAAIGLAEGRLLALRANPDDPREIAPAAESLSFLKAMRGRWISKPSSIDSLYYLAPAANACPEGGRCGALPGTELAAPASQKDPWAAETTLRYLTEKEVQAPKYAKRLVEVEGRRFLLPPGNLRGIAADGSVLRMTLSEVLKAGGRELVAGADVQYDRLKEAEKKATAIKRQRQIDAGLADAELALTKDAYEGLGRFTGSISLEALRRLEREGRVYYFNATPDGGGRRTFLHPLAALSKSPSDLVIMVQVWGQNLPADKFASLEDMQSSDWKGAFEKVEFGALGVQALIKEAKEAETAARRSGWLSLKLEGYGFALQGEAVVDVFTSEEEYRKALEKAADPKEPSNKWSFHKVSDLSLGLDDQDRVVQAKGMGFDVKMGESSATSWISQELLALVADSSGKVLKAYTSQDQLEKDAASWKLEDMTGEVYERTDRSISPTHRLKRYVDPSSGQSVALGRSILQRRLDEAKDEQGDVGRWAYMPYNWGNILLELPRGIVKVPVEMITGRDPNQEGYIGRVYMYQTEGGATQRYGVVGTVLRVIDIFELLPDPVERYMDPSQFPERVDNNGPLLPGEWEHEKKPRTTDGSADVHFGKGFIGREIRWATEDQRDSRGRILSSFAGGVRRSFVEDVRGRGRDYQGGLYTDSRVDNLQGMIPAEEVLRRVGPNTDSTGRAKVDARPDHIAVERVRAEIEIRLGAAQHQQRRQIYEAYLKLIESRAQALAASGDAEGAKAALKTGDLVRRSMEAALKTAAPADGSPVPMPPGLPDL
ncbi:MAG: hypothetical protein HY748_08135 [Elusimicrobia bacterium]|nr:hypothetical protein [Elusimicrobiota bacterium]